MGSTRYKAGQLNPRQARFAAEYLKHGNGEAAAIAAGYTENNAAWTADNLLKNCPGVIELIAQSRKAVAVEGTYNLKTAMKECEDTMELAVKTENANAYAKAVELRSKLNGLLVEKHDVRQVGFHVSVGGIDFNKRDGTEPIPDEIDITATSKEDDDAEDLF